LLFFEDLHLIAYIKIIYRGVVEVISLDMPRRRNIIRKAFAKEPSKAVISVVMVDAKKMLQQVGYMVFIVPGSSFIKRLIQGHRPKAIVGIGCLLEVKEGNVMAERYGLVSMGVVSTKDGCVETEVDWDKVFEIALLGIDPQSVPKELRKFLSRRWFLEVLFVHWPVLLNPFFWKDKVVLF
jgi:hypothetical protein